MRLVDRLIRRTARAQTTLPLKERLGKRLRETYYNAEVLYRIQDKTAPLNLAVSDEAPRRVNLLIPEINFASFYGGYMAKFHLARKLVAAGYRVRMVIVDPSVHAPSTWRNAVSDYAGLETIFDDIEVAYQGDRRESLTINPADRVIATTWWTAYLAHDLATRTGGPPFVYLIQEYEPFTFPMGSYYAMAQHSYSFPHHALFSSALLKDYFELRGIGVFDGRAPEPGRVSPFEPKHSTNPSHTLSPRREGQGEGACVEEAARNRESRRPENASGSAASFENAIVKFDAEEVSAALEAKRSRSGKGSRKLLFYARPEAHATRNMFEVAFLALARTIEESVFDDSWEFHGIGSGHGDIDLPQGRKLRMLGKFSLGDYRDALLRYDLGLSLMYTPHPSLLPLDMAAAGMVVVTNRCMNKTAERLQILSTNLIGAEPHIDGVRDGLREAVERVADTQRRLDGAKVNWAGQWDESFHEEFMGRMKTWLE